MRRFIAFLAAVLVAWPAFSAPLVSGPSSPKSAYSVTITFETGDTEDSRAIPVSGFCSVRYQQASGDDASLYAVTTADTAASSGTLIGAFTASTTTATTFTAGTRWVKAVATDATVGGSVMVIDCSPLTGGGGGGGIFSVTSYGATGNGTTNDRVAINLAVDAACDAGSGVVYFPPGTYGVGSTGANRFYSGIQVTCSNVLLLGVPNASVIVPLFTHGGSLLNVCPAFDNTPYGANEDCDSVANIENVRVEGLRFYDADSSLTCNNYSAARGCCGDGANSSCTAGHEEETHGIFMAECDNCSVIGNVVDGLGDEGIVLHATTGNVVSGNVVTNTPSIRGSAGAGISVDGTGVLVTGNEVSGIQRDPHGDAGNCTTLCDNKGAGISVGVGSDIVVSNNILTDVDADFGIQLSSSTSVLSDVVVTGNRVEMLNIDDYGCVETPIYPGTPSRCAVAGVGSGGNPVRDGIVVSENVLTGGIVFNDVDNLGSVKILGNEVEGDEGIGITGSGSPLTITGNTIKAFDDQGIWVVGLEDDDRTDAVTVANNSLFGNNKDAVQDTAIDIYGADVDGAGAGNECGTDTIVPGGVNVSGNTIVASSTSSSITRGIAAFPCARMTANNNVIDFLSAGYATGNNAGIFGAAIASGNRIKNAGVYGILSFGDYVIYSGNRIENPAFTGIHVSDALAASGTPPPGSGLMPSITGNTIITASSPAIDANGEMPTCVGNTSISTTAADRTIVCGEAGAGLGCTADTAAGGVCDLNQVCNTGDSGC